MDDIHLDDPRKFSAKQLKIKQEALKRRRSLWQYLFDLIVKTLICAIMLSLNFTLFANSGNYSLFASSMRLNMEAEIIYAAILAISFILMFISSFYRSLENIILSLCFASVCVATINQFATFEKKSGLLILFSGVFSENINVILYEYSLWIVAGACFVLFWLILKMLNRQIMLYFMIILGALLGWVLSEAYLNTSTSHFKVVASSPILRSENFGKNLVFLSFENLTSPNNLKNMYQTSRRYPNIQESFYHSLGFFVKNDFTLYPNVLIDNADNPFINLISAYNPEANGDITNKVQTSAVRTDYFNFSSLQKDKMYLKESSLYEKLRKDNYNLNVYQTGDIDTCYLNNKIAVAFCKEKYNTPISLIGNQFSLMEKVLLLASQWLNSTGFVSSLDPILASIGYVYNVNGLKPLGFNVNNLNALNSFKALDQIVESMDRQTGNQAYFAIMDIPSDTYIYNAFCQLKPMSGWNDEFANLYSKKSTDERRSFYAEQVSCLYGYLEKFMQQLDRAGHLENTTIIIEGINNPQGLNKPEKDFYSQLQTKRQGVLAIRPAGAKKSQIDYSVCSTSSVLNSFFFTHKPCKEFSDVKTTEKMMTTIKKQIDTDKYKSHVITTAQKSFGEWFSAWTAYNQFDNNLQYETSKAVPNEITESSNANIKEDIVVDVKEAPVADNIVEDIPEEKMQSIGVAMGNTVNNKNEVEALTIKVIEEEKELENIANNEEKIVNEVSVDDNVIEDVIPNTLFDETLKKHQKTEDAIAKAKKALIEKAKNNLSQVKNMDDNKVSIEENVKTDSEINKVLEAPMVEGKKLSPEELKKQYREALKQQSANKEQHIDIKVKVIEN